MIKIISTFLISVFLMSNFAFASQLNAQLDDQKSDIKALNELQATQDHMTTYDATQTDGEWFRLVLSLAFHVIKSSTKKWVKDEVKKIVTGEDEHRLNDYGDTGYCTHPDEW